MAATPQDCSLVTSGRKHINGVDLYYELRGTGKHAVLMFPGSLGKYNNTPLLNGGEETFWQGCTQISFILLLKFLNKERFTIVTWDQRGYGRSRPPARDFPIEYLERDAKDGVDLMKALGFDKFSLLGWSAGGASCLIAAAKNPDLIIKTVAWSSCAFVTQEDLVGYNGCRDIKAAPAEYWMPLEEVYGDGFPKIWEACMDSLKLFAEKPGGSICLELLPLISCPTLIIHGDEDNMVPPYHAAVLHKRIKGSRLHMMPGGKHSIHLEFPDEFNKIVEDFLEE